MSKKTSMIYLICWFSIQHYVIMSSQVCCNVSRWNTRSHWSFLEIGLYLYLLHMLTSSSYNIFGTSINYSINGFRHDASIQFTEIKCFRGPFCIKRTSLFLLINWGRDVNQHINYIIFLSFFSDENLSAISFSTLLTLFFNNSRPFCVTLN